MRLAPLLLPLCLLALTGEGKTAPQRGTDLMICNTTGARVAVAVVSFLPGLNQWIMTGWTFVPPQDCRSAGLYDRGPLYYYAEQEQTGKSWPGGSGAAKAFCIANQTMKRLAKGAPCPSGERSVGFIAITASGSGEQRISLQ